MSRIRKKVKKELSNVEDKNGLRISYHEKVCAERMKTLFKAIDEMRKDIKELKSYMNKGKGAVALLIIIGGLITAFFGYFKING
jgi:uncharacterized coiled-coil DUF342 family protein|tara:strand:+ start:172 stop:423 length:252 start_codon:yes stop_codon:yes gene_type:complete